MKVTALRLRYSYDNDGICKWKKGDISEVKMTSFKRCCEKSQQALDDDFIGFGEHDESLNKVERMCIYQCSPWPEGAVFDEMPIDFCPFCAEKIDIIIEG